jgi:hypothetical protein
MRATKGHHRQRYDQGWEFVRIAIDDATRLAYAEVLDDEKAVTAAGFLRRAVKHFAGYGITVERLITDNGNPYRSTVHAIACHALGIRWPAGSTSTIADDRTGALSHKPPIARLNELNNFVGPYI